MKFALKPRRSILWALSLLLAVGTIGCDSGAESKSNDSVTESSSNDSGKSADAEQSASSTPSEITRENTAKTASKKPNVIEPDLNDARFHQAIKAVADEYLKYGLVNTRVNQIATPRVASQLCDAPVFDPDPEPRLSDIDQDAAHGQKLYFLFANDIAHYTNRDGSSSPVGQTLVKEAWTSKPGNPNARNLRTHASAVRVNPRVQVGDKTLEIGQRTDLFVMVKQADDAPGTDDGWVYGVIDADAREVKSAGAVASCIACHDGQRDRLFREGIPDWDAEAKKLSPNRPAPDDESEAK